MNKMNKTLEQKIAYEKMIGDLTLLLPSDIVKDSISAVKISRNIADYFLSLQKWISVENLPNTFNKFGESDYVLCLTESLEQVVCWYSKTSNGWIVASHKANSEIIKNITYWMPLPLLPICDE